MDYFLHFLLIKRPIEVTFAGTAAAPISEDVIRYWWSLGIPLCEAYGMSECAGAVTLNMPDHFMFGSCGFELPGTDREVNLFLL